MPATIELFYDFRSPYSYLAFTQLVRIDAELILRPMSLLSVMEKVGNVPTTLTCKAKGDYARVDLGRWAHRYGVALNPSDMRANDGDACSRAVLGAASTDEAIAVTLALYRALWSKAVTLGDSAAVVKTLKDAGVDTATIATRIDGAEIVDKLATNTEEAAQRGVFGSPTMFVGDAMFFGNDRLDFVAQELARQDQAA
ncbi:2-hydroxychromene-2-carboxylate isomerase [Hyphomonas sp.]|uniref:2-hydroxychromene-2-carboxylate isomerase n=1 Tax=Hyphomonas sp. TaxID=87 RepID=UPI003D27FDB8